MSMGDLSSVSIGDGCRLHAPGRTALDLTNAQIRSLLRLDENAAVEGTLRLAGAVIHGTLALHGQLSQPEHLSLVGGSAMTVDGDVYLNRLRADGGHVTFRGATLGSLHAGGAQLSNPRGTTLYLSAAVIKGPVRLANGFTSTGRVALNRTTIEGRLQLTGGTFTCPAPERGSEQRHAIAAISATVRGHGSRLGGGHAQRELHRRNHHLAGRRPGDLARALRHRRLDLRPLRDTTGRTVEAGLGSRSQNKPGSPARPNLTPVPTSKRQGFSGSTDTPARLSRSSSPSAGAPATSAGQS